MPKRYNSLNKIKIDLALSGICAQCGRRFTDPLCTHATPEQIAATRAMDAEADAHPMFTHGQSAASYNGKQLPNPCPKCGGLLIVKTRRMRQRDAPDYVTEFVGCANFEVNGCRHTEPLTEKIKAAIDSVVHEEVEF